MSHWYDRFENWVPVILLVAALIILRLFGSYIGVG